MKRQNLFAIACVATTAAATLVGNVGSASAALTGEFSFFGSATNPATSVTVTANSISFFANPVGPAPSAQTSSSNPGQILILEDSQTGSFIPFTTGSLFGSFTTSDSSLTNNSPLTFSTGIGNPANLLLDLGTPGGDTFTVNNVLNLNMVSAGSFINYIVTVNGFFTSATGEQTSGEGAFTIQRGAETFSNLTFSSTFMTKAVPEPTALAGLGLVAGLLAVSRRRKADHN
ncbi:PEP-CTERM sorting domain-containing protein [Limnofasciculus baicalensis]|uniref:PEP-CTERM sorting domain-containing protein n=1 Tax=Limnofasciculus baicalensis BBK-W-15 TaxID=2699891 RepID=A0AAE3GV32_9CYAN|nr:PEP-CTERM sorting domain-containing protein [Limnofasciculus baicalensis]MCP2730617.1 PEP-CTERM sorting domain-containing protein [Limnofasciculus baicalensis BBK-W-15]